MPQNDTAEEATEYTAADLPELRRKLTKLLVAQHGDSRSLRDIKRDMAARGKEISGLSDVIEELEMQTGDYGTE
jgi:hypothetical protein